MDSKKILENLTSEIYKDGFSPAVSEAGDALKNVVKTARFLLAPLDIAAAYQDRFKRWTQKIADKVPVENLSQGHPSVGGPTFEQLKWIEEDSIIEELFLNLLARSIDSQRVNEAHPAFSNLIGQLSPDEAIILYQLKKHNTFKIQSNKTAPKGGGSWISSRLISTDFPVNKLIFSQNFLMYLNHLQSLNIVHLNSGSTDVLKKDVDPQIFSVSEILRLQEFGLLFCKACVPDLWENSL